MRSRAGPVTELSIFATELSETGMKTLLYEHSSPGSRNETFHIEQLHFGNIAAKMA